MGSQQGGEFTSPVAPFRPAGWPFRFVGRKRGELKISRTTLQHAGSGLWLGKWTAPGNGDWRNYGHKAIARVREVCTTAGLCYERALIRVNGEGGNTPFITGCQEAGLRCLTRIAAYELLDIPAICLHLNAAVWHEVEDSGSGPSDLLARVAWEATSNPSPAAAPGPGASLHLHPRGVAIAANDLPTA